ncbi:MAG: NAD(P)-dependent oxidoreductase [Clostridiales bacterium]|jgi:nucleoside-diphosphate-sugar epimerase|nr:NAD(P)-dependent oxidoreductase [Clostridiales bacterium]
MEKKKVLLTGASGNVGSNTLLKLLEQGYEVTVFDLPSKKNKKVLEKFKDKVKIVYGSINDALLVNKTVKDADIVIHLAAIIPPLADKNHELAKKVNYLGTENVVHAIKYHNPNCFLIFASSISVYGDRTKNYWINVNDPISISEGDYYAMTKVVAEKMIRESGINYTIFRLTGIMGLPHTDPLMFHMPLNTKLEIASSSVTAQAFANACGHTDKLNGNTYNLGGGENCRTDYREFLTVMLNIYGLNIKYFKLEAFAEKNFHCGYYEDSYVLNDILDFQHETLEDYYEFVRCNTPKAMRIMTKIFSPSIGYFLCKKSEPYMAKKKKRKLLINRYYLK